MPAWLDYGIPLTGLLMSAVTLYHTIIERMLTMQHQMGELTATSAKHDLCLHHLEKNIEMLQSHMKHN